VAEIVSNPQAMDRCVVRGAETLLGGRLVKGFGQVAQLCTHNGVRTIKLTSTSKK